MISLLNHQLHHVENYATMSRFNRFLLNPFKYLHSIMYSKVFNKFMDKSIHLNTKTFWNEEIAINFPSAIDIYLSGGKTHISELRLAKYLINHLQEDSVFIDIGAHFGYFSLLASQVIHRGKVISIEPSPNTFEVLKLNTEKNKVIQAFNIALGAQKEVLNFYEFPTYYSEYNTINKEQYQLEDWFNQVKIKTVEIKCEKGDTFLKDHNFIPDFIKIDVEGSEEQVILGLKDTLTQDKPIIIMEFCTTARGNVKHVQADLELKKLGYQAHFINKIGELNAIHQETKLYVDSQCMESDNIVYLVN